MLSTEEIVKKLEERIKLINSFQAFMPIRFMVEEPEKQK